MKWTRYEQNARCNEFVARRSPFTVGSRPDYPDDLHPRYRLTREGGQVLVIISDKVRQCCVFLYVDAIDGPTPIGTGFILGEIVDGIAYEYLVTARHVIEFARHKYNPSRIMVRINGEDGAPAGWRELEISGFLGMEGDDETTGAAWLARKDDTTRIDICAALFPRALTAGVEAMAWNVAYIADLKLVQEMNIRAGDEVAIIGLYRNHLTTERNIPVVRSGIISAMLEAPVRTKLGPSWVYLIEARSVSGLSGSPVFVLSGADRLRHSPIHGEVLDHLPSQYAWLLGVVHGHFDVENSEEWDTIWGRERMNDGMAMVTPCDMLPRLLHREGFMKRRIGTKATPDDLATLDQLDVPQDGGNAHTRSGFDEVCVVRPGLPSRRLNLVKKAEEHRLGVVTMAVTPDVLVEVSLKPLLGDVAGSCLRTQVSALRRRRKFSSWLGLRNPSTFISVAKRRPLRMGYIDGRIR